MALEIECKYLVDIKKWNEFLNNIPKEQIDKAVIKQLYLFDENGTCVRIRSYENKGTTLTIKSKTSNNLMVRNEIELPISARSLDAEAALEILKLAVPFSLIVKTRYRVVYENKLWEVDVFHDDFDGLVLAEIELENVNEKYAIPPFITENVTDKNEYTNSSLSKSKFLKSRSGIES